MFGQTYYHSLIRKYVILVGTLFNDIHITRTNSSGDTTALLKVPITYGPKDKMLTRVLQDPNIDRPTATMPLPMISFEMGKMKYDGTRKLNTIGRASVRDATDSSKFKYQYNPVPYNINMNLYILTKTQEDGWQILEQILPTFTPDYTLSVNAVPEMEIVQDIPIILNNVTSEDDYEGSFQERRFVLHTLTFTLKTNIYGQVLTQGVILSANINTSIPGQKYTATGTAPGEPITENWESQF